MAAKGKTRIAVPALVMGPAKRGPVGDDGDGEDMESGEGVPPDFEEAASRAFPELAEDTGRMQAFYEAVRACCESMGED